MAALASVSSAPVVEQDAPLGVAIRIVDVDLHQEAVELRLRQRIGCFLLQRVLRRQHVERLRQIVARARNRDVLFLHGLQQRGLGARAGAVDFVGHQQLGEHRSGDEAERALAGAALVQHFGAENVEGIRSGVNWMRLASSPSVVPRFHQLGLGEAGHADQKRVTADRIVTRVFSTTRSWPKMTVEIASFTARI